MFFGVESTNRPIGVERYGPSDLWGLESDFLLPTFTQWKRTVQTGSGAGGGWGSLARI